MLPSGHPSTLITSAVDHSLTPGQPHHPGRGDGSPKLGTKDSRLGRCFIRQSTVEKVSLIVL